MLDVVLHFLSVHFLLLWRLIRLVSLFDKSWFLCSFDHGLKRNLVKRYLVLAHLSHRYSHGQKQILLLLTFVHLDGVFMQPLIDEKGEVDLSPSNLLPRAELLLPHWILIKHYVSLAFRVYFFSVLGLFVTKLHVPRERNRWNLLVQNYHSVRENSRIFVLDRESAFEGCCHVHSVWVLPVTLKKDLRILKTMTRLLSIFSERSRILEPLCFLFDVIFLNNKAKRQEAIFVGDIAFKLLEWNRDCQAIRSYPNSSL